MLKTPSGLGDVLFFATAKKSQPAVPPHMMDNALGWKFLVAAIAWTDALLLDGPLLPARVQKFARMAREAPAW